MKAQSIVKKQDICNLIEHIKESYIYKNKDSILETIDEPMNYILKFNPSRKDLIPYMK